METQKEINMDTKECKDCGKELSLDMFHYSNKPKGIRKSYCKELQL